MGSTPHVFRAVDRHKVRAGTKGDTHAAMERGYVNAPHLLKMSSSTIEVERSKQIFFVEGRNQQKKAIDWPKHSFRDLWIFHLKIQISRRKTAILLRILMEFPDPQTDCWGEQIRMKCLFLMIDEWLFCRGSFEDLHQNKLPTSTTNSLKVHPQLNFSFSN